MGERMRKLSDVARRFRWRHSAEGKAHEHGQQVHQALRRSLAHDPNHIRDRRYRRR